MKRILAAYKDLICIIFSESPWIVLIVFVVSVLQGAASSVFVWVSATLFDMGILAAKGEIKFLALVSLLILFILTALLPNLLNLAVWDFAEPRSQLILRTAYRRKMVSKLKKLSYEHIENEQTMEIIDKAFNRVEASARHLFPMYIWMLLSSGVAVLGNIYLIGSVHWWLILTILVPFAFEVYFGQRFFQNIYDKMETFWKKERQYGIIGNILRFRDFVKENKLFQLSDYLINDYRKRLNMRNKEYESYYFKHLKKQFTSLHLTKFAKLANAIILLIIYINGDITIGFLISLTYAIFNSVYVDLENCTFLFRWSGFHINTFDYYDKYFALSEDRYECKEVLPDDFSIEFNDVHFAYPGTNKEILNGISFKIHSGEKISIVGENGAGKTTIIKLLLGLFQPNSGEIHIGRKPLSIYSYESRCRLFGTVFQDFVKYNVTLAENIGIGNIEKINDSKSIEEAMKKAKVDAFIDTLINKENTLLGRDFEGGVDLSGGQWQRVAIARAFMGNKPILILDEPTSQLDPMAESKIYSDFVNISSGKTTLFITHRLGSTMITDRILVISGGRVVQSGTHKELLARHGPYADMFNAQKQWYVKNKSRDDPNDR
jgi:ATP-binding cassette subfamily B protein